jgi:hypothetical protein
MRKYDQVSWRRKHPLLTGHTRCAPFVEIRYQMEGVEDFEVGKGVLSHIYPFIQWISFIG